MEGTPFDLRKPVLIGPRLQEVPGLGFDHNFCLSSPGEAWAERHAARFTAEVVFSPAHFRIYSHTHAHTTHIELSLISSDRKTSFFISQSVSPSQWACPGGLYKPTRSPVLHCQLPGWLNNRKGRG